MFSKASSEETGLKEEEYLAVALCDDKIDFTRIKQVLDYLFHNLDAEYSLKEVKDKSFIEGRVGEILVKGKKLGIIGEINPKVICNFGLEYPVACFELNVNALMDLI